MRKAESKCSQPQRDDHDSNESLASLDSESPNFISSSHMFTWQELQLLSDSEEKSLQDEKQRYSEDPINSLFFQEAQQALEFFHSIKNQSTLTPGKELIPALGEHPPQSGMQESSSSLPFENGLLSGSVKLENLKQISALVFKQFVKQEHLTYSNLFKRLGVDDGEMRARNNLKRRMYDVINVLSAAGFVRKQGCSLRRIELKNYSQLPQILKQEIETKKRIRIKRMLKIDCLYRIVVLAKIKNQSITTSGPSGHESMTKILHCESPKISFPLFAIICNTIKVERIKKSINDQQVFVHINGNEYELMGDTNTIEIKFREKTKPNKTLTHTELKIEPNFIEVKIE